MIVHANERGDQLRHNNTMASLLPSRKWGAAPEFLLYEDVRSALLVSRVFRREVAEHIQTVRERSEICEQFFDDFDTLSVASADVFAKLPPEYVLRYCTYCISQWDRIDIIPQRIGGLEYLRHSARLCHILRLRMVGSFSKQGWGFVLCRRLKIILIGSVVIPKE